MVAPSFTRMLTSKPRICQDLAHQPIEDVQARWFPPEKIYYVVWRLPITSIQGDVEMALCCFRRSEPLTCQYIQNYCIFILGPFILLLRGTRCPSGLHPLKLPHDFYANSCLKITSAILHRIIPETRIDRRHNSYRYLASGDDLCEFLPSSLVSTIVGYAGGDSHRRIGDRETATALD